MKKNPDAVAQPETDNSEQGKGADAKDKIIYGKAAGGGGTNPTKSGGINRPTKGLGL